jgi:hypothetical protein
MIIEIAENSLIVRASHDKEKYRAESTLYYHIKLSLKKKGYDVIRQVPEKDGHMTSCPYYIRDRKGKFCWMDNNHALRLLNEAFNTKREIQLAFINLERY